MRAAHAVGDVRTAEHALMALVPDGALMQRAAAGLASVCAGMLGRVYGARVVVLAGSGDNGGDALFAGARLARRGALVTAVAAGKGVHAAGAAALRQAGGQVIGGAHAAVGVEPATAGFVGAQVAGPITGADMIIDGILGIGGRGGLREPAATMAGLTAAAADAGAVVVAVDLPSGIDADTGVVAGTAIRADVTVTFGTIKPGLMVDPGASYAGTVQLVDIGLRPHLTARPAVEAMQLADVAALLPRPSAESDKYRRGVLGVLAGSQRYTGAAVLSVGGAIRGGAGMVRLVSAKPAADVVRQHWPEAVITVIEPGGPAGVTEAGVGAQAIEAAGRVQAWVAGPGLGTGEDAADLLGAVLATPLPVLVDADGLTVLAGRKDLLSRPAGAQTLLTPHAGELARLTGGDHGEIEANRLESARSAAAELGVTVLLKGSTTVVATADRDEPAFVNPTGTPWLATAGSGDVLSGLAGALLAEGILPARTAAAVAAFLHGLAGRLAANGAPVGAGDVLAAIPAAIRMVNDASEEVAVRAGRTGRRPRT
jgi:ADP-dependent NAD(P)H-hydrate dehydratase / NAD(P)H-hydrate epimerase